MGQSLGRDVAIVTGAGCGIGRAIALSLAAEGAAVGVFARTAVEIAETAAMISSAGGHANCAAGRCYRCGGRRRGRFGDCKQARPGDAARQRCGDTRSGGSRLAGGTG